MEITTMKFLHLLVKGFKGKQNILVLNNDTIRMATTLYLWAFAHTEIEVMTGDLPSILTK